MKNKQIKLNLGCGDKYLSGYINCDILSNIKLDKKVDLGKFPYPFKTGYADEILMDNVLEHLPDLVPVMAELHRILKKKGLLRIYVPYVKSDWAFQNPTHLHYFTERSLDYFSKDYNRDYYTKAKYSIIKAKLFSEGRTLQSKLRNAIPFRNYLRYFLFNMYDGIYFELEAVK